MSAAKRSRLLTQDDTVSSTSEIIMQNNEAEGSDATNSAKAGGSNAGFQGFRGKYSGNAQDNAKYSERRKEYVTLTTRTATTKHITWCCRSKGTQREILTPQTNTQDFLFSADDTLQSQPINMYAPLFGDSKLYKMASNGNEPGWLKWRLLRIRFNVVFRHYLGSWIQDGYKKYNYASPGTTIAEAPGFYFGQGTQATNNFAQPIQVQSGMWVYRDMYNDFISQQTAGTGNIDPIPDEGNGTGTEANNQYWRSKKCIANQDLMLDLNHVGENFNFEREVASKGSYYISGTQIKSVFQPSQIFTNNNWYDEFVTPNIGNIIADLEQVATAATPYTTPNREGFNLLIVPSDMVYLPTESVDGSAILHCQPGFKTMMHLKCEADWEGWDYNYGLTFPERTNLLKQHQMFNELAKENNKAYRETQVQKQFKLPIMGEDERIVKIN